MKVLQRKVSVKSDKKLDLNTLKRRGSSRWKLSKMCSLSVNRKTSVLRVCKSMHSWMRSKDLKVILRRLLCRNFLLLICDRTLAWVAYLVLQVKDLLSYIIHRREIRRQKDWIINSIPMWLHRHLGLMLMNLSICNSRMPNSQACTRHSQHHTNKVSYFTIISKMRLMSTESILNLVGWNFSVTLVWYDNFVFYVNSCGSQHQQSII